MRSVLDNPEQGMMISQAVLGTLALAVVLAALLVVGRLLWCLVIALRERRYVISSISAISLVCIVAALSMVVIVWFGYAVAHTGKDASSDLTVVLITVPPFFLVSLGLWLLGGKLLSRLRSSVVTSP